MPYQVLDQLSTTSLHRSSNKAADEVDFKVTEGVEEDMIDREIQGHNP
jgi:hypothetical protein